MARAVYSNALRNRTNRLKLPVRKKPYKSSLAPGIRLAYRRNDGPGSWSVETTQWLKRFALADDHEDANNVSVLSFHQAQQQALKLARGSEGDSDKPVTVDQALDAYQTDLAARGGAKANAAGIRKHCPPALLSKAVALLTEQELTAWRNGLAAKGLKPSSVTRYSKSLKACLALAARRDKRIGNGHAWKNGLKPLKGGNAPTRTDYYLPDASILAIVRECYADDADFGALIDVLAVTGVRESQALKLMPCDLLDDKPEAPRVLMPCSNKGKGREPEQRALAITPRLATVLRARAMARGANRPLFDKAWTTSAQFRVVLKRLGLDSALTPYVLRHSSVIRQIRAGTPLRLIAFSHDTSVGELERTYSRYLNSASDDLTRLGLLADAHLPADNVVALARQAS
ncbi:tyrosine-type recombinase/integrase [Bradyrhizobium diazoefficiens]|uniref:tyrosine-type recombinase/integrase n=1 Tax=Bradyrhizobium diazoefficiens TaxID=1355477 RepID=UPI0015B63F63|nr:site-specific integrase [Bradyrhizobium diazoefficiens]QLD40523.1 site-specific integrase [Bradyrhizobium diazoefficiens]